MRRASFSLRRNLVRRIFDDGTESFRAFSSTRHALAGHHPQAREKRRCRSTIDAFTRLANAWSTRQSNIAAIIAGRAIWPKMALRAQASAVAVTIGAGYRKMPWPDKHEASSVGNARTSHSLRMPWISIWVEGERHV
jgi:hypothetical protein